MRLFAVRYVLKVIPSVKAMRMLLFVFMFQVKWVKVCMFLISRWFNLLWKGTFKVLPVNMPWRRRRGVQVTLPYLDLGARWGWVVNATPRRSCTSGILCARKRTSFCRNIMSVSRISWCFEENPHVYAFSATRRGGRSPGDLPSRTSCIEQPLKQFPCCFNAWKTCFCVSVVHANRLLHAGKHCALSRGDAMTQAFTHIAQLMLSGRAMARQQRRCAPLTHCIP